MEQYVLLAILILGPVEEEPIHGREATWSAEFNSLDNCNAAGQELGKKLNSEPGAKFAQLLDYVCVKK